MAMSSIPKAVLFLQFFTVWAASEGNKELGETNQTCNQQRADLVIVLDSSYSVRPKDFQLAKSFITNIVANLSVSQTQVRVAVVRYERDVDVISSLADSYNSSTLIDAVDRMEHKAMPGTHTGKALRITREQVLETGDVKKIVLVITDGESTDFDETEIEAENLRAVGVRLVWLYIYNESGSHQDLDTEKAYMKDRGDPTVTVGSFDNLGDDLVLKILEISCQEIPPVNTETAETYAAKTAIPTDQEITVPESSATLTTISSDQETTILESSAAPTTISSDRETTIPESSAAPTTISSDRETTIPESSAAPTTIHSDQETTVPESSAAPTTISSDPETTIPESSAAPTTISSDPETTIPESSAAPTTIHSDQETTVPESSAAPTTISSDQETTIPESFAAPTAISSDEETTAPESSAGTTTISADQETTAPESSAGTTTISTDQETTVPESSAGTTTISTDQETTAPERFSPPEITILQPPVLSTTAASLTEITVPEASASRDSSTRQQTVETPSTVGKTDPGQQWLIYAGAGAGSVAVTAVTMTIGRIMYYLWRRGLAPKSNDVEMQSITSKAIG